MFNTIKDKPVTKFMQIVICVINIFLFVYTIYTPYLCLRNIGYDALAHTASFELGLMKPIDYKIEASLKTILFIIYPLMCLISSLIVLKRLKMKLLSKIGLICGLYSLGMLIADVALLWLNMQYYRYEVVIGWLFHFVVIT